MAYIWDDDGWAFKAARRRIRWLAGGAARPRDAAVPREQRGGSARRERGQFRRAARQHGDELLPTPAGMALAQGEPRVDHGGVGRGREVCGRRECSSMPAGPSAA